MRMFLKTDHMRNMCSQFPKKGVPIRANIPCIPYNITHMLVDIMKWLDPKICNFCKDSVDTRSSGVDTMLQIQGRMIKQKGQVVSTLDQVVSTQCFKYKAKRSSSVDTRSGSVDTRDSFQKTFWPIWDTMSTLDQAVSTLETASIKPSGQYGTLCRH
ncbi:hypothetical protein Taro_053502 [Colocasia esculenta]|uniref:Uncharacterized protein n=1 Tax=Colocasia esculenta TaxID=4460 RepID=A0A843XMT9_COLES|nr:hypothetical protein [Colocasia esculenta]